MQFDGMPAAVNYISPTQINVLVPNVTLSTTQVVVTNAGSIGAGGVNGRPTSTDLRSSAGRIIKWWRRTGISVMRQKAAHSLA